MSANANLGPPVRELRSEFFPRGVALIDADQVANSDFGFQLVASATHSYDLRGSDDPAWISTAVYTGRRFLEEDDGALDAFSVTTGPLLSLDDEAFGLKGRPYVSGGLVRSADEHLYAEVGGGTELSQPIDRELALFGVATLDWRDFESDRDAFDGAYGGMFAGVVYTPERQTELRAAVFARVDLGCEECTTSAEIGLRLSAARSFSVAETFGPATFDLPWRLTVFAQASYRGFDGPDPAVDADETRRDVDARIGARLVAPLAWSARNYVLRTSGSSGETDIGGSPVLMDALNGDVITPLSADGGFWIRYAGPQPARLLPAWRVLDGPSSEPALADLVAGQIVLFGGQGSGVEPASRHAALRRRPARRD